LTVGSGTRVGITGRAGFLLRLFVGLVTGSGTASPAYRLATARAGKSANGHAELGGAIPVLVVNVTRLTVTGILRLIGLAHDRFSLSRGRGSDLTVAACLAWRVRGDQAGVAVMSATPERSNR
jgi:hypothetical protein